VFLNVTIVLIVITLKHVKAALALFSLPAAIRNRVVRLVIPAVWLYHRSYFHH
jgi:hypothetical protein